MRICCLIFVYFLFSSVVPKLFHLTGISVIANSPLRIDLSCVLDHVVSELTALLRKVLA
jgi:cullin-associated NEDD8-dissociated protein 1